MARVLRGGPLIPAIFRRRAEEGVAALLPHLGSSPATPAAGAGRLTHTGFGGSTKLPQQKALPFGRRGVLSQGQKTMMRMEQFSSRRSIMAGSKPGDMPWGPIAFGGVIGLALGFRMSKK